jgi:hypothetical protein
MDRSLELELVLVCNYQKCQRQPHSMVEGSDHHELESGRYGRVKVTEGRETYARPTFLMLSLKMYAVASVSS